MRTYADVMAERIMTPMQKYATGPEQVTVEVRSDGGRVRTAMGYYEFGTLLGGKGKIRATLVNGKEQGVFVMENDEVIVVA
jgi:hypothetical protein